MMNIVDKYTADTTPDADEGVVAIEYVLVAAAVVAALATIFTNFGSALNTKLQSVITGVTS